MEWSICTKNPTEIEASKIHGCGTSVKRATATEGQFTLKAVELRLEWLATGPPWARPLGNFAGSWASSWSDQHHLGTRIEPWCDPSAPQKPAFAELVESWRADPEAQGALFDAMVHPLIPYGMRGGVDQGESNAGEPERYCELLPL